MTVFLIVNKLFYVGSCFICKGPFDIGDSSGSWENLVTLKSSGLQRHICDECRHKPALWSETMNPDWNVSDDEYSD